MLSPIPDFQINCPAAEADQALKQAVGAYEKAEHAVVLWFGVPPVVARAWGRPAGSYSYSFGTAQMNTKGSSLVLRN